MESITSPERPHIDVATGAGMTRLVIDFVFIEQYRRRL